MATAVIGMRRSGKTSLLSQWLADRLAGGAPRESLIRLDCEDERLDGLQAHDLGWLVEEHRRQHPHLAGVRCTWFLDELQLVKGWESLARRLLDEGGVDLILSGGSARQLSREVASPLRGRVHEVLVLPFSFREWLRHTGDEPTRGWARVPATERAALDHCLRAYLGEGGLPETVGVADHDRRLLHKAIVDSVILRDVIERHAVSNPIALRWIVRHLLGRPAGAFSAQKMFDALKRQGVAVGKDTVHALLAHLEDAFLVHTVSLHTASDRQRMVNPRKAYPADPGLIPLFARTVQPQFARALETVVLHELRRRGADVGYLKTTGGMEVDFHALVPGRSPLLVQVCAGRRDEATLETQVRALRSGLEEHGDARAHLVTLDPSPPALTLPDGVTWWPAAQWLLEQWDED
jgi:hypothetical protein